MPKTTRTYHRVPSGQRKKKGEKIRTITISKSIKALYDTKRKVIVTYLFDKEKYTMKQAKEWVEENKDNATHQQLVEIDDLMERRRVQIEAIDKEIYAKVLARLEEE